MHHSLLVCLASVLLSSGMLSIATEYCGKAIDALQRALKLNPLAAESLFQSLNRFFKSGLHFVASRIILEDTADPLLHVGVEPETRFDLHRLMQLYRKNHLADMAAFAFNHNIIVPADVAQPVPEQGFEHFL